MAIGGDPFAAAASVVDAGINYAANSATNASNREIADSTNRANADLNGANNWYNSAQSQAQRDFQEYMSGTAYQRGMKDMKLAGLNPILAASQGGASTPSGSSATASSIPAQMGPPNTAFKTDALEKAVQLSKVSADTDTSRAQANNLAKQTELATTTIANAKAQTPVIQSNAKKAAADAQVAENDKNRSNIEAIPVNAANRSSLTNNLTDWLTNFLAHGQHSARSIVENTKPFELPKQPSSGSLIANDKWIQNQRSEYFKTHSRR